MHGQRGQGTIEYVALLAVLALLLGAAAATATAGGPGVANAVMSQVRRALCIVTGAACVAERRLPCVVASTRDAKHVALTIVVVRLDGDRFVLREQLSDDTVRLTIARRGGLGGEVASGSRVRIKVRGRTIASEREVHAAAETFIGTGEVHIADDDHEADEILRALGRSGPLGLGRRGPEPAETFFEGGTRGLASAGVSGQAAGASVEGLVETVAGVRRERDSGEVTISLGSSAMGWGLLTAVAMGPTGSVDRTVAVELTLDRHGRPIGLGLTASGTIAAGAILAPGIAEPLGLRGGAASAEMTGRRWELRARVDLTDPDVAAAWKAVRRNPTNLAAIRRLGAIMRSQGHLDVRSYAVSTDADGGALSVANGVKLGGEIDSTTERARLLRAATRPPGGVWERRVDCLAA